MKRSHTSNVQDGWQSAPTLSAQWTCKNLGSSNLLLRQIVPPKNADVAIPDPLHRCPPMALLLMEEILHRRRHIWQYTMTCTPAPPFQCCVLKHCAPVQDFSHSTSLFWGHFLKPMLNGEHEGHDSKCVWWCRIFSINRLQKSCLLVFWPSCALAACSHVWLYVRMYVRMLVCM